MAVLTESDRLKTNQDNRVYVRAILQTILYCAQQGLPLRGHRELLDTEASINIGNFRLLMVLLSRNNEVVKQKLTSGTKNVTWLGHAIQNSLISLLADSVRQMIFNELHVAQYFTFVC